MHTYINIYISCRSPRRRGEDDEDDDFDIPAKPTLIPPLKEVAVEINLKESGHAHDSGNAGPPVDPELLRTEVRRGLNDDQVAERRIRFGFNELVEKKVNPLLKFLRYAPF